MPNMNGDGFIDETQFVTFVSNTPANADYQLNNAIANAVSAQAVLGSGSAHSCTVNVAAYANTLVQLMIQRLTNCGYTSTLSGTTLTVTWP
jgi:hypothetical protein